MTNAATPATFIGTLIMADPPQCVVRELPWSPGGKQIPFLAGPGALAQLPCVLTPLQPDRLIFIADPAVQGFIPRIAYPATILCLPQGEADKTLRWLDEAAARALQDGATRRSVVISFGGGLACNMAGMLAATLFRGVPLIHIPTTLLAMHDTVTSLKQAVNVGGHKNMLGIYHAPHAILCDTDLLRTLPPNHVQAALIEVIKNGLILGEPFSRRAEELCKRPDAFIDIIESGVAAKQTLMQHDPREKGPAIVFEYGHTVGHAIEATCSGSLNHGQCIYWGMVIAGRVARELSLMPAEVHTRHDAMLQLAGSVSMPSAAIAIADLLAAAAFDNKRGHLSPKADHVAMVLLEDIGRPVRTDGLPLVRVPMSVVSSALSTLPFVR